MFLTTQNTTYDLWILKTWTRRTHQIYDTSFPNGVGKGIGLRKGIWVLSIIFLNVHLYLFLSICVYIYVINIYIYMNQNWNCCYLLIQRSWYWSFFLISVIFYNFRTSQKGYQGNNITFYLTEQNFSYCSTYVLLYECILPGRRQSGK